MNAAFSAPGMMAKKCKCCGGQMMVRVADHKRGWGIFCSKSCKAKHQERRTHQNRDYHRRQEAAGEFRDCMEEVELGWDAHKSWKAGS